jgi:surface carbohydrate biosynthesis protein
MITPVIEREYFVKQIDVLILIEHVVRELEMAVLLKNLLSERGLTSEIESTKFNKEALIFKYKPRVLVTPWAYNNIEMDYFKSFNYFSKKPPIILNLHQEQITNERNLTYMLPTDEAKNVYHLSWGQKFTNLLLDIGCSNKYIYELGNPRLDFYKKELFAYSMTKESLAKEFNLDVEKKWCLIIANGIHHLSEEDINLFESRGVGYREISHIAREAHFTLLEWIEIYLNNNDDYQFIYRPHPSYASKDHNDKDLVNLANKHTNFNIVSEHSLRDWIVHSNLSMSFFSTAAVESTVAQKPHVLIRPLDLNSDLEVTIFKNTLNKIEVYKEFCNVLKRDDLKVDSNLIENIKKEVKINSNTLVTRNLVDVIESFIENEEKYKIEYKVKIITFTKVSFKFITKKILSFLVSNSFFARKVLNQLKDIRWSYIFREGPDYFTKKDIKTIQNRLDT